MISIVMGYYNRLRLLNYTLTTIAKTAHTDYEVIIVDDFSDRANSLKNLNEDFPNMNLKIIRMADISKEKDYCNPCIPFNVGFRHSVGDKIIIQNPECCHVGDVLTYTEQNLTDDIYLSYHCYASLPEDLLLLRTGHPITMHDNVLSHHGGCWYNHKDIRPCAYHFTSAITRKNLIELNGFDERFATGLNFDDDEFITRVQNKKLNIEFVEDPFVIHQFHGKSIKNKKAPPPTTSNKDLFKVVLDEKLVRADNKIDIV